VAIKTVSPPEPLQAFLARSVNCRCQHPLPDIYKLGEIYAIYLACFQRVVVVADGLATATEELVFLHVRRTDHNSS
jgi:hypothetical protein